MAPAAAKYSRPATSPRATGVPRPASASVPRPQLPSSYRYKDTGRLCGSEKHTTDQHVRCAADMADMGHNVEHDPLGIQGSGNA
jgi:hypothetical protein